MNKSKCIQNYLNKNFPLKKKEIKTFLIYPKNNKYALLVSLIISASSHDEQVNKVTNILFQRADNPFKMIKLGKNKINKIIKSVGLSNKKSEYIIKMSRMIIDIGFPKNKKDLLKLPGVGNKIAGVFLINTNINTDFPVDTHVKQFAIRHKLTKNKNPTKISEDLKRIFPERNWAKLHYQMILENRFFLKKKKI